MTCQKTHDTHIYVPQSKCEPAAWVCSVSSPLSIACWSVFNCWCCHACRCSKFQEFNVGNRFGFLFVCFVVRLGVWIWSHLSKKGQIQLSVSMIWKSILLSQQLVLCFTVAITTGFLERQPAKCLVLSAECVLLYIFKGQRNLSGFISQLPLREYNWHYFNHFSDKGLLIASSRWENHLFIQQRSVLRLSGLEKHTHTHTTTMIGGLKKHWLDEPWLLSIRLGLLFSHLLFRPLPVFCPPLPLLLM